MSLEDKEQGTKKSLVVPGPLIPVFLGTWFQCETLNNLLASYPFILSKKSSWSRLGWLAINPQRRLRKELGSKQVSWEVILGTKREELRRTRQKSRTNVPKMMGL